MDCPHCHSNNTKLCTHKTNLGYDQYRCRACKRQFNQRTGTEFNFIEFPNEVVMVVLHYYFRFKVSLDDVVELMAMRNIYLSHQTVSNWAQLFGTQLGMKLRVKRKGKAGSKWHIDATYLKIGGHWCYLYRAIDKEGNLLDVYLSDTRDQTTAEKFFEQAQQTTDVVPEQVTTDKEPALYPAVSNAFPDETKHRDSKYMNNRIEQHHRGIKSRCKVMKGFQEPFHALKFCTTFEEIKQHYYLPKSSRSERRKVFMPKFQEIQNMINLAA